jgi:hypothetical protein
MKTTHCVRIALASSVVFLCAISPSFAALSLTSLSHSENFDFLASTGTGNSWNNDQSPENANQSPGWWWFGDNLTGYDASDGSSSAPDLTSFGDDADRALGSLSGSANDYTVWSLVIENNLAAPITALTITFTGEQWRDGDATSDPITFSYKTSSLDSDFDARSDFGDDFGEQIPDATWTANPDLNFSGTDDLAGDVAIDGNNPTNQSARSDTFSVSIPVGDLIALRWYDENATLSDHGLAIDNLTITAITAIPEPSALLFGGLICAVVGLECVRRRYFPRGRT